MERFDGWWGLRGDGKVLKIIEDVGDPERGVGVPLARVLPGRVAENRTLIHVRTPTVQLHEESLRMATRIRMAMTEAERSIAITGIDEDDLPSQLAHELAVAFSQFAPGQVVLVDAQTTADTTTGAGLAEVLSGDSSLSSALGEPHNGGPWLLPSGNTTAEGAYLSFSPKYAEVFASLSQRFKHVVVDAGSLASPASLIRISHCDTVAVSLASGPHHRREVIRMQKELARTRARMLGVVLARKSP